MTDHGMGRAGEAGSGMLRLIGRRSFLLGAAGMGALALPIP
jgi:hypothetical protein